MESDRSNKIDICQCAFTGDRHTISRIIDVLAISMYLESYIMGKALNKLLFIIIYINSLFAS